MSKAKDAEAYAVDEVKDIRDKARALEIYHRQARNVEAETKACEIRLRAERRCGQLLAEREMAKGAPGNQHTGPLARCDGTKSLSDLGISHTQSSRWQKLAASRKQRRSSGWRAVWSGSCRPTQAMCLAVSRENV